MRNSGRHWALAGFVLVCSMTLMASRPAGAVEDGLFGVRIGASYRELVQKFGAPHGIVFPSGSGMIFQTVAPPPTAGLPDFSQQPQATETPVWVFPIRAATLDAKHSQWVYDFRKKKGIAVGIVLSGEGADAVVTDVMVAGFPQFLKGKPVPVTTVKGIVLQSTFEEVLKKYGYPPVIEIYAPSGISVGGRGGAMQAGGGARGAMRAGGGGRGMGRGGGGGRGARGGGMRGGGMRGGGRGGRGGMRGGRGRAEAPGLGDSMAQSEMRRFQLVLTGAPGMRGGRRGGGMRGGGMRGGGMRGGGGRGGGMRGGGRRGGGVLPPLGAGPAAAAAEMLTASAVVNHQAISFSRDCVMVYEGIAFTLHDFKVFRIHVSE